MDNQRWFDNFRKSKEYTFLHKKPIAYFSIEYALSDALPTYAGGLGILAGDYIKELWDQKIPAVAVGMYYQKRYGFDPSATDSNAPLITPELQELVPVVDENNKRVIVTIPLAEGDVFAKAWLWQKDSIKVYLLDTNVEENTEEAKNICLELYAADKDMRFKQEMILGIGGFRLLEALTIQPSLYHMNEGHSALLGLEIIRHEMQKRKIGFESAKKLASHHVIFTNHTLVPAGNDIFSSGMLSIALNRYAGEMNVPVQSLVDLGIITDTHDFSMSIMAMRVAGKINGVSKLHAEVAVKVWPEFSFQPVTNGVHIPTWEATVEHTTGKKNLLQYINKISGNTWGENELLLGWARRFVLYKRPLALFEEIDRFNAIAKSANRPLRVVIAGIAHRSDDGGKELMYTLQQYIENVLKGSVVYLQGYNRTIAKLLLQGCDVWLNTPVVGSEACGTSGMKASLNGALALSTKDGWMAEVDISEIGWEVDSERVTDSLLQILENDIIPTYYSDASSKWISLQENGKKLIKDCFSTTRMLKDYFETTYLPILTSSYAHY